MSLSEMRSALPLPTSGAQDCVLRDDHGSGWCDGFVYDVFPQAETGDFSLVICRGRLQVWPFSWLIS